MIKVYVTSLLKSEGEKERETKVNGEFVEQN
jgi:hypothetical protein